MYRLLFQLCILWLAHTYPLKDTFDAFGLLWTSSYQKEKNVKQTVVRISLIMYSMIYALLEHHLYKSVHKISKYQYDIIFTIGYHPYKIRINNKPRSKDTYIIGMYNDLNQDVSELIFPYIGPNQDFFGLTYTPADFNQSAIEVVYSDDSKIHFNVFDDMKLP